MNMFFTPVSLIPSPMKYILFGIWFFLGLLFVLGLVNIYDNFVFASKAIATEATIVKLGPLRGGTGSKASSFKSPKQTGFHRIVELSYRDRTGKEFSHEEDMYGPRTIGDRVTIHYHADKPAKVLVWHKDDSKVGVIIVLLLALGAWALISKLEKTDFQPDPMFSEVADSLQIKALRDQFNKWDKSLSKVKDEDFLDLLNLIEDGDTNEAVTELVDIHQITKEKAREIVTSLELSISEFCRVRKNNSNPKKFQK